MSRGKSNFVSTIQFPIKKKEKRRKKKKKKTIAKKNIASQLAKSQENKQHKYR